MKKQSSCPTCKTRNKVFHYSPILQLDICEGCKQDLSVEIDHFSQKEFHDDEIPKDTLLFYALEVVKIPFKEIMKRALKERIQNYEKAISSIKDHHRTASVGGENLDVTVEKCQRAIKGMESQLKDLGGN